jgi:hypothetical protein
MNWHDSKLGHVAYSDTLTYHIHVKPGCAYLTRLDLHGQVTRVGTYNGDRAKLNAMAAAVAWESEDGII